MDHTAAWGGHSYAAYSDYRYAKERADKAEELLRDLCKRLKAGGDGRYIKEPAELHAWWSRQVAEELRDPNDPGPVIGADWYEIVDGDEPTYAHPDA